MNYLPQTFNHKDNRLDALLALRGFACLMVVIYHCNPPRNSILYKNYDFSWLIFSFGYVAVWIFFVLSGYLMSKAFYTERYTTDVPGVIKFWRNRAIRIFPLYYFAVLILTILVYPDWLKIENWGYLIRICTFTYDLSLQVQSGLNFNSVFWSLSTEVQFYILVPFIYTYLKPHLFKRKQVLLLAVGLFFISFIYRYIFWIIFHTQLIGNFSYMFKYWYAPILMNLDLFISGFIVNSWLQQSTKFDKQSKIKLSQISNKLPKLSKKYLAVILVIMLYLFTAHHLYHQELGNLPERAGKGIRTATTFFILPPLTALITCFFILIFDSDIYHLHFKNYEKLSFSSILRNPPRILEVFGNLSYGVYIWHAPIIEKITPIFTSSIPVEAFYTKVTATLLLSIVLAIVTYYLVELPFSKWKIFRQTEK